MKQKDVRDTHKSLPFTFSGWDMAGDYGDIQFYNVEFTEDFGPIRKGEKYDCVTRYDADAQLVGYDSKGQEIFRFGIKYAAA